MLPWKNIIALTLAGPLFAACIVQEEKANRPAHQLTSIEALANGGSREFLFQIGEIQDIAENFILENTKQEQLLRMRANYQPMTLHLHHRWSKLGIFCQSWCLGR